MPFTIMKNFSTSLFFSLLTLAIPLSSGAQSKIIGGTKANDAAYPWMAAVARSNDQSLFQRQFCGGSLIAPDWILTAAHCVEGEVPEGLQILVNFTDLSDSSGAEIRGVKGIYLHPSFRDTGGDLYNDVALILLDAPIDINTVTPIAVATSPYAVTTGAGVRAIGWGDTKSSPRYPNELQEVDLSIASITSARKIYGVSNLDNRHLAAIASGKDTCAGDSGGPLFDPDGAAAGLSPLLVGITSYGLGCAKPDIPGIYTNVGNYFSWISAFLAQPTDVDPVITLAGKGRPILNGTSRTNKRNGTSFGRRVRAGRTVVRKYAVSNAPGSLPLSLSKTSTSGRAFKIRSAPPPYLFGGSTGRISVSFRAPVTSRNGKSRATLRIRTNAPAAFYYSFRLEAKFRKSKKKS